MLSRIIIDILLLIAAIVLPWWLAFLIGLVLLFLLSSFYEFIFLGLIIDSLYSVPLISFFKIQFVITILCIVIFLISLPIKSRLRV